MNRRCIGALPCLTAFVLLISGCSAGMRLATAPAAPVDVTGTYNLLLYGCRYPDDIKNLAILMPEGESYPVDVYDLPTSYHIVKGMAGSEALRKADAFVRCGGIRRVSGMRMRRIIGPHGATIGYEVRALYFPLEFGITDVLQVTYRLADGKVAAYVRVDPDVERELESSGSDRENHGK